MIYGADYSQQEQIQAAYKTAKDAVYLALKIAEDGVYGSVIDLGHFVHQAWKDFGMLNYPPSV